MVMGQRQVSQSRCGGAMDTWTSSGALIRAFLRGCLTLHQCLVPALQCLENPPELLWWEELMFCLCH